MKKEDIKLEGLEGFEEIIPQMDDTPVFSFEKEGDELQGIITERTNNTGKNKNSTIYRIKTDKGDLKFWGSALLDDRLADITDKQQVRIVYLGKKMGKKNEYRDYVVYVKTK
jgi:hypothetical protein